MKNLPHISIFLLILTLFNGCFIPYLGNEKEYPNRQTRMKEMVNENIFDFLEFSDKMKKQVVDFDLIIYNIKGFEDYFAILTLDTDTEMKQFLIYNIEYLTGILDLFDTQMTKDGSYHWSWNQMLIDVRKQIKNLY